DRGPWACGARAKPPPARGGGARGRRRGPAELKEAKRLAQKYQASVVILGHTGAARWKEEEGLLYANAGTWAFRLTLPPADAKDTVWDAVLDKLRKDPTGMVTSTHQLPCATVEAGQGQGTL